MSDARIASKLREQIIKFSGELLDIMLIDKVFFFFNNCHFHCAELMHNIKRLNIGHRSFLITLGVAF